MVRIRLKRMGRRNRPFYRVNAIEKREKRDGKVLESLGWYDPVSRDPNRQYSLNTDRIKHWLAQGAQPSDTVNDLLAKAQVIDAQAWAEERRKRYAKRLELIKSKKAAEAAEAQAAAAAAAAAAAKAAEAEATPAPAEESA